MNISLHSIQLHTQLMSHDNNHEVALFLKNGNVLKGFYDQSSVNSIVMFKDVKIYASTNNKKPIETYANFQVDLDDVERAITHKGE